MLPFSQSHESYQARKSLRKEEGEIKNDIAVYQKLKELASTATYVGEERLKIEFPKIYEGYADLKQDSKDSAERFLIKHLSKDDESAEEIKNLILLQDQVDALSSLIREYVTMVHASEAKRYTHVGDRDVEVMSDIERMEKTRSASHNVLIRQLQIIRKMCQGAKLDITWSNVLGLYSDRTYREEVQRWAEHVADYFVTVSETTITSKP